MTSGTFKRTYDEAGPGWIDRYEETTCFQRFSSDGLEFELGIAWPNGGENDNSPLSNAEKARRIGGSEQHHGSAPFFYQCFLKLRKK